MQKDELLKSKEFWVEYYQLKMFDLIENYRIENSMNTTQLAQQLGVSKGKITKALNGNYNQKFSDIVELSLAFGKVPIIEFVDIETMSKKK